MRIFQSNLMFQTVYVLAKFCFVIWWLITYSTLYLREIIIGLGREFVRTPLRGVDFLDNILIDTSDEHNFVIIRESMNGCFEYPQYHHPTHEKKFYDDLKKKFANFCGQNRNHFCQDFILLSSCFGWRFWL